jgi:hypothetical protein
VVVIKPVVDVIGGHTTTFMTTSTSEARRETARHDASPGKSTRVQNAPSGHIAMVQAGLFGHKIRCQSGQHPHQALMPIRPSL